MLSREGLIFIAATNKLVPLMPHLMFYAPYATEKDIGSPPPGIHMPRVLRSGKAEAYIIVVPAPPVK